MAALDSSSDSEHEHDTLVEGGVQVSSSSLEPETNSFHRQNHHHEAAVKSFGLVPMLPMAVNTRSSDVRKKPRTCLPKACSTKPEDVRMAFLNQGTTYWTIVLHASTLLAFVSFIQLLIYFLVFGMTGHYRVMVALLPVHDVIVVWFIILDALDFLVLILVRFGKCISKRYGMSKQLDTYFILLSTFLLIASFIGSIAFPIYATPNLLTTVNGTIKEHHIDNDCLEQRNAFIEAGTSWDAVPVLEEICRKHILCIEPCRDFRTLYFWVYGMYILAIFRLFTLVTFWNTVSFLHMILDVKEDFIEYQLTLEKSP